MKQRKEKNTSYALLERAFLIIYLTMMLVVIVVSIQDYARAFYLTSENGPIQMFTVVGYLLVCAVAVRMHLQGTVAFANGVAVICLAMGLRELDFQDRFTTMSITKIRFYISDIVPLSEKIVVAIMVVSFLSYLFCFIKKNYRNFLLAVKGGYKAALLALNGIVCVFLSKLLDSNPSIYACIVEETMEFAIPYFFLTALLLHGRRLSAPYS